MITIMARPWPVVIGGNEPEPEHERAGGNPDQIPQLPQRVPGKTLALPGGSFFRTMEEEDDRRGPEPEPNPEDALTLACRVSESTGALLGKGGAA